jgi:hypothetical protein
MSLVTGPFLSALILTGVFALMWSNYRERWLGYWAIASAIWATRYLVALVLDNYQYDVAAHAVPFMAIARGYFLLQGGYALLERPMPRWWLATFALDALVLLWEIFAGDVIIAGAVGVPHYLLFSTATIVTAAKITLTRHQWGRSAVFVGAFLTLIGIANLTFPWLSSEPGWAPFMFMLAHGAQLGVGFSALLLFHRRATMERDEARHRLEIALSQALSGYLPICAHCKAIRDQHDVWQPLERYFSDRHVVAFSHGVCPECEVIHYAELFEEAR